MVSLAIDRAGGHQHLLSCCAVVSLPEVGQVSRHRRRDLRRGQSQRIGRLVQPGPGGADEGADAWTSWKVAEALLLLDLQGLSSLECAGVRAAARAAPRVWLGLFRGRR